MDHFVAAEEQLASERLRQKIEEVNVAARTNLAPIHDHVNFTLQKAYFKCAYECYDRSRRQEEISKCVENCSIPLTNGQQTYDNEMAKFQERLNRFLIICQDKYEAAKLQQKTGATFDLVSCADQAIQDSIKERLNRSLMVYQDKYEAAKLQQKTGATNDLVSCADQAILDNIKVLPILAYELKASFGISGNGPL